MRRMMPKAGHSDWMMKVSVICIQNKRGGLDEEAYGWWQELLNTPMRYDNYHGVAELDTPYFLVTMETYPPTTEHEIIEWEKADDKAKVILQTCLGLQDSIRITG
jgi:hypothetical protein